MDVARARRDISWLPPTRDLHERIHEITVLRSRSSRRVPPFSRRERVRLLNASLADLKQYTQRELLFPDGTRPLCHGACVQTCLHTRVVPRASQRGQRDPRHPHMIHEIYSRLHSSSRGTVLRIRGSPSHGDTRTRHSRLTSSAATVNFLGKSANATASDIQTDFVVRRCSSRHLSERARTSSSGRRQYYRLFTAHDGRSAGSPWTIATEPGSLADGPEESPKKPASTVGEIDSVQLTSRGGRGESRIFRVKSSAVCLDTRLSSD